jgi:hypothetical protein
MIIVVLATRPHSNYLFEAIKPIHLKPGSMRVVRRLITVIIVACLSALSYSQALPAPSKEPKPYKILTSGKQITIKSAKNIKSIMVWTASGHRIVEQQEINASSYTFNVNVNEKYFFVMIHLDGMKPFTEKIGVQ